MQNDFEKKIQQQMEQFSLAPNEAVWKQVEMRIAKEKKRRTAGWLFLAGLLVVIAGGAIWFALSSSNEKPATITHQKTFSNRQSTAGTLQKSRGNSNIDKESITPERKAVPGKSVKGLLRTGTHVNLNKSGSNNDNLAVKRMSADAGKPVEALKKDIQSNGGKLASVPEDKVANSALVKTPGTLPPHKYLITNRVSSPGKENPNGVLTAELNKQISSAAAGSIYKNKNGQVTQTKHRWNAVFSLSTGFSDNIKGVGLPAAKAVSDVSYTSPGPVLQSSANSNRAVYRLQYKAGFSFGLGINMQKSTGKRWSFSAGVDYHYFSARSRVSSKKNSMVNIYDSVLMKNVLVREFFVNGDSTNFSNRYHLLEFPAGLHYKINNNTKRQLQLFAGIVPGFVINTSALYLNTKAGMFYKERDQFNSFHLAAQAGLLLTLKNSGKYQINTGPVIKYGLTNLSKASTHNNQHLFFTGIQTNINLK